MGNSTLKVGDKINYMDKRIGWEAHERWGELKGNWSSYHLLGEGEDGTVYHGMAQGYSYEPQFDKFTDVEIMEIENEQVPTNKQ